MKSWKRSAAWHPADGERFVRGPLPLTWFDAASGLPGKAVFVGFRLWYRVGLTGSLTVKFSAREHAKHCDRTTVTRALAVLEAAGLVTVARKAGCSPVVTVHPSAGASPAGSGDDAVLTSAASARPAGRSGTGDPGAT